jgi:hypothetical protein
MATAVIGLSAIGVMAMPHDAKAWWRGGIGVGIVVPPVVVAPAPYYAVPVYAPPYYPPPVYAAPRYVPPPVAYVAPRRIWVPSHWQGPYWVPGHWG